MTARRLSLITVLLFALAACGSSGGSDGTARTGGATNDGGTGNPASGDSAAIKVKAAAEAATYRQVATTWPGPTEMLKPVEGKAVVMSCGNVAPVCAENAQEAIDAFTALGWSAGTVKDGQVQPQVQAGLVDQAVQAKVDAVVLISIDVNTIKASVERAVQAGTFITCVMCLSGPQWVGKVFDVTADWKTQGAMAAVGLLAERGSDLKAAIFKDNAYPTTVQRADGFAEKIKASCPTCTTQVAVFNSLDIGKPGPPQFNALLAANPKGSGKLTDVVGEYADFGVTIAKSAQQAGRTDVTISGFDGSPHEVAILQSQNPPYHQTVAEPYTYADWAAADLSARHKAGAELWKGYGELSSVIIDRTNVNQFLNGYPAPAGDWRTSTFKSKWNAS